MRYGSENKDLRQEIAAARLTPGSNDRHALIFETVCKIVDGGAVLYLLEEIPDQTEDCLTVLVDGETVISFELERGLANPQPKEVERWNVSEYRKQKGQRNTHKLEIALDYTRSELG